MSLDESDALTLTAALRRMTLIDPGETPALEPLTGGAIDPIDLRAAAQHRKGAGAGDFTIGAEPGSGGVLPIGNRDGCAARWHDQ